MMLTLYLIAIALALLAPILVSPILDRSNARPVPPVPDSPDPYRIAYLRGGENEVVRLLLFDLVRRAYLTIVADEGAQAKDRMISQADEPPADDELSELEASLVGFFNVPKKPTEIYRSLIPALVRKRFETEQDDLVQMNMLIPQAVKSKMITADRAAKALGCILGFLLGFVHFDNMAAGIAIAALFFVGQRYVDRVLPRRRRISKLGRKYISAIQAAFEDVKSKASQPSAKDDRNTLLLPVGFYGTSVLIGTPYDAYHYFYPYAILTGWGFGSEFSGGCGAGGTGGGWAGDGGFGGGDGGFGGGDGGGGDGGGGCGGGG
jgi:uncharacterized protein (TIGR04222 family)